VAKHYQKRNLLHPRNGRWLIRYPVPKNLIGHIRGKTGKPLRVIEVYLKTADVREARILAPAAIAAIEKRIRRARDGTSAADEALEEIADAEMRRAYDLMAARPLHFEGKIAGFSEAIDYDPAGFGGQSETPSPFLSGLTTWALAESHVRRLESDPNKERVEKLAMLIWQAHRIAIDRFRAGTALPPTLPSTLGSPLAPSIARLPSIGGPRISEVVEAYFRHPETKLSRAWSNSCRVTYRLFQDHIADAAFASITRQQVDSFAIALSSLRGTWGQYSGAKAMRFHDLLKRFPAGHGDGISGATINRHLAALGALWKFAQKRDHIDFNLPTPFASQRRRVEKPDNAPITIPDLNKLLGANTDSTLHWAMLVSLFSGMRASEVGNLTTAEVRRPEASTSYFDLTARKVAADGPESVKTENARRVIPIHPELIALGFLNTVPSKGPIFAAIKLSPAGGRGASLGDKFTALASKCGVAATFRELRNTFQAACDRAGLPKSHRDMLMGHRRDFGSAIYNRPGLAADDLAQSMTKIEFPSLEIPTMQEPSKVRKGRAK